jgi:hypothetical protein
MRNTGIVLILSMIALIFFWQGSEATQTTTATLMQEVMDQAGATPHRGEALYWGSLGEDFLDMEELESLADRVAASLGVLPHGPRQLLAEDTYHLVDIPGHLPAGLTARVILQSVPPIANNPDSDKGTFLLIQLVEEGGAYRVLEAGERMPKLLRPYGPKGELTLDLTAHLPGKISVADMSSLARELLRGAQAREVEGMTGDNLVSITGYTPLVEEYLLLGHEKINLNIALRYDQHEGLTTLRLGVPLISGGY